MYPALKDFSYHDTIVPGKKEDITLLHYLLKRVVVLRSISHHIKYDTLYQDLGYYNALPKKKFKI